MKDCGAWDVGGCVLFLMLPGTVTAPLVPGIRETCNLSAHSIPSSPRPIPVTTTTPGVQVASFHRSHIQHAKAWLCCCTLPMAERLSFPALPQTIDAALPTSNLQRACWQA